jgi:hypothetical protein
MERSIELIGMQENENDCTTTCRNKVPVVETVGCNAGGKNSKVSAWNAQFRAVCK